MNINSREALGEEIRLLLIVSFETDPVARPDDSLGQGDAVARFHQLMFREGSSGVNSRVTRNARLSPSPHCDQSCACCAACSISAATSLGCDSYTE
jgi:hypothetical protein